MKVAKLEIKMILALVLSRYEYKLVAASGKPPKQFPRPDQNDIHKVFPIIWSLTHQKLIRFMFLVTTDGRSMLP
jgi:hypothetical protein